MKVLFNCEPSVLTTAMIATEMSAAMSPYSIAVAPDSSLAKRFKKCVTVCFTSVDVCPRSGQRSSPGQPRSDWRGVLAAELIVLKKARTLFDNALGNRLSLALTTTKQGEVL
jgi:hypothetical protein